MFRFRLNDCSARSESRTRPVLLSRTWIIDFRNIASTWVAPLSTITKACKRYLIVLWITLPTTFCNRKNAKSWIRH